MAYEIESAWDIFINALIHCSFCALPLLTVISFFGSYLNFTNRFLGQLAGISYAIYFIHQNISQTAILFTRFPQTGLYEKYVLSLFMALILCFAVCLILRPV